MRFKSRERSGLKSPPTSLKARGMGAMSPAQGLTVQGGGEEPRHAQNQIIRCDSYYPRCDFEHVTQFP